MKITVTYAADRHSHQNFTGPRFFHVNFSNIEPLAHFKEYCRLRFHNWEISLPHSRRGYTSVAPPFTTNVWPVMKSLTTRPKMASAMSLG